MTRSNDFEGDFSFADEIEDIGFSAFSKDELTSVEADVRRTSDYQLMTTRVHPAKERMLSQNAFKRLRLRWLEVAAVQENASCGPAGCFPAASFSSW